MAQQHHGPTYTIAQSTPDPPRTALNTREALLLLYVVDYCEKRQFKDAAAALKREGRVQPDAKPPIDSKEGLLFEWWTCFWEVYTARVHPGKVHSKIAKIYSDNLYQTKFGQAVAAQASNGRQGTSQPSNASQPAPQGVNGQGSSASYSSNPPSMNGVQPSSAPSGPMPGMPAANATFHNPSLQHLQPRMPGYPAPGPGMPMQQPNYAQRSAGFTIVQVGPMGQMQQGQRMPNGTVYGPNPNQRPPTGQQDPQQQQDSQAARSSGSPKQPGGPSTAQNSSPHNGQAYEPSGIETQQQGTPRIQPNRGQKRPSPADDDQYKDGSPPSHKKPKRSPQENGAPLPSTPSLANAQPPGNGRLPMSAGNFNGIPPNKTTPVMAGISFPPQGGQQGNLPNGPAQLGPGMPAAMVGQLRELNQTHLRTQANTAHQTDQQYFAQMQQTAVNTYNIKPTYPTPQNPALAGQPGTTTESSIRGATNAPKGSMLPPPPPSTTNHPTPGTANGTPGKNTPVMGGLAPRNAGNKDGSSPGASPESARPASRPIPGSTPQMTPASIPGAASTPGGPTAISAASPSQMATPQQISRPQTQSPSSAALVRPSTASSNGIGSAVPNPSAMIHARYGGATPSNGANGAIGGGAANSATSNSMGGSSGMLGGGEQLSNDLFMGLADNAPFDFQMMGYQGEDAFAANMNFDFVSNLGMDETYNMYINDTSLDSVNGP